MQCGIPPDECIHLNRTDRGVIDVKVNMQGCVLVENVADLKFELGVKSNTVKRNWSWLCCAWKEIELEERLLRSVR